MCVGTDKLPDGPMDRRGWTDEDVEFLPLPSNWMRQGEGQGLLTYPQTGGGGKGRGATPGEGSRQQGINGARGGEGVSEQKPMDGG